MAVSLGANEIRKGRLIVVFGGGRDLDGHLHEPRRIRREVELAQFHGAFRNSFARI
jgi:hypothetical protein